MELAFDDRKLLVLGVHEVSLDTVKRYFGSFQRSDRRMTLFAKLTEYIDAVKRAGCGQSVIIDGSFVMGCVDQPDDIDLVLILPSGWDLEAALQPYQYNLVSKKYVRSSHGFDLFVVTAGSPEEAGWIEYFGKTSPRWREHFGWPPETRKGMVRVTL